MSEIDEYQERIESVLIFLDDLGAFPVISRLTSGILDDMRQEYDNCTLYMDSHGKLHGHADLEQLQNVLSRLHEEMDHLGLSQLFIW